MSVGIGQFLGVCYDSVVFSYHTAKYICTLAHHARRKPVPKKKPAQFEWWYC